MKYVFAFVTAALLLAGCTGDEGPMGPAGPQGEQGESGPGTRIVYQSTMPIPTNSAFVVYVPEIKLNDMPVVSVYVCIEGFDLWIELPFYFEDFPDWGMMYLLEEGKVTFSNCKHYYYKIVIVT